MGNKKSKAANKPTLKSYVGNQGRKKFEYKHADKFIPLFTTRTNLLVDGYIRMKIVDALNMHRY